MELQVLEMEKTQSVKRRDCLAEKTCKKGTKLFKIKYFSKCWEIGKKFDGKIIPLFNMNFLNSLTWFLFFS